jgi:hypothetical protein
MYAYNNVNIIDGDIEMIRDMTNKLLSKGIKINDIMFTCKNKFHHETIDGIDFTIVDTNYQHDINMIVKSLIYSDNKKWHIGDRVITGFNIGYIVDIIDNKLVVQFNDGEELFEDDSQKISLAFCVGASKLQGSEYPYIVGYMNEYDNVSIIDNRYKHNIFIRHTKKCYLIISNYKNPPSDTIFLLIHNFNLIDDILNIIKRNYLSIYFQDIYNYFIMDNQYKIESNLYKKFRFWFKLNNCFCYIKNGEKIKFG